jgi:hypothetical protein
MALQQWYLQFRPRTYAELRAMPRGHKVAIFDSLSPSSRPGGIEFNDPNVWLAEIHRCDQEQMNRSMLTYTRMVTGMTVVITAATLIMLLVSLKLI